MAVNKKIPQRQCVGCGEDKDKKSMIRVIKNAENEIISTWPKTAEINFGGSEVDKI